MSSQKAQHIRQLFKNFEEGEMIKILSTGFVERKGETYDMLCHHYDSTTNNHFPSLVSMLEEMQSLICPLLEAFTGVLLVLRRAVAENGQIVAEMPFSVDDLTDAQRKKIYAWEFCVRKPDEPDYNDPEYQKQLIDILRLPVSELDCPARARKCFYRNGLSTIAELVEWSEEKLFHSTKNFGKVTLRKVKDRLLERGLRLGMKLAPEIMYLLNNPDAVIPD